MAQIVPGDEIRPFKLDERGNVVGPGVFIGPEAQVLPGFVTMTVDTINQLYGAGYIAGKLAASPTTIAIPPAPLPPGIYSAKVTIGINAGGMSYDMELPNGQHVNHVVSLKDR